MKLIKVRDKSNVLIEYHPHAESLNKKLITESSTWKYPNRLHTNIHGENSQFIRFNNSKVRQTGLIDDMSFSMELINNNRTTSISVTLTGNENKDKVILLSNLEALRNNIASHPEDPFIVMPKLSDSS